MRIIIFTRLLLTTLATVLGSSSATSQIFTNLYSFTNGSDGSLPEAGLVLSGNALYGTAQYGGTNNVGTVFAINTNGMGFTTLHTFCNSDGAYPFGSLVLAGDTLYGTTFDGGTNGSGVVFAVNTDGTGFATLHTFSPRNADNSDGASPFASLVLSGNTLYGLGFEGGSNGVGTVFAVNIDGTCFRTIHTFSSVSDGALPTTGLVLSGEMLYGTAQEGGTNDAGTVFAVNTNGTGFTTLHTFGPLGENSAAYWTNSDGILPRGLVLSGNTLYGATEWGGSNGVGTVFAVKTDGTGFTTLHTFSQASEDSPLTNSDGVYPTASLVLCSNTLYGTAQYGGTNGNGTVFALNTDGTGFTMLHVFGQANYPTTSLNLRNSDGANPAANLVFVGNTLYGTAEMGGPTGNGTVFAINLASSAIPLNFQASGQNLILTWDNPAFSLLTAPSVSGPWTTVSGATIPYSTGMTNGVQFFSLGRP